MQSKRVLVVEDDALVRRAYERALAPTWEVTSVGTGTDALTALGAGTFSVIVSDIDVPGTSGIELLKAIRATDLDVPVVLVTGYPSLESAQDAVNYGAFSYLTKPVEAAALREVVARAGGLGAVLALQRAAATTPGGQASFGDKAGQEACFENALRTMWMAFQPIVAFGERSIIGYEALLRTEETTLRSPPDLLAVAERLGRLSELGHVARARVAEQIPSAPASARFFVNLHAHDLSDDLLFAADSELAMFASRVVLEITERASLDGIDDLPSRIASLRSRGYQIAIDDLGAGYAGLTSLPKLEPDIVKLDMSLVRDIDKSHTKRQLVSSMVGVCEDLGMTVVTEGVETAEERDTLIGLQCDLFQGYLFARPQRGFCDAAF